MGWWKRLTGGTATTSREAAPQAATTPRRVTPEAAATLQREGAILLDVRERSEWTSGRAPKALHIPLGQLPARRGELPSGTTVLTICRSGGRSARAARMLRSGGHTVVDVSGGMHAWQRAGLPVTASGGRTGQVV